MFDICLVSSSGQHWENQWSYVLSNFKPRQLYVIGSVNPSIIPFKECVQVANAEELPGTLVVASPFNAQYFPGEVALPAFEHPETCCYLFGSDNTHLSSDQLGERDPDHLVYIPTDTIDNMYSYMAGAVVLYDRKVKHG